MDRPEAIRISQFDKVHMDTGGLYQKKKEKREPLNSQPTFLHVEPDRAGPLYVGDSVVI